MDLTRLKIGAKLALAIGVVMLLMIALSGFALRQMAIINSHTEALAGDWLPSLRALAQMQNMVNEMRRAELLQVLAKSPQDRAGETRRMVDVRKHLGEAQADYAPLVSSAEEGQLFDEAKKALAIYLVANDQLLVLAQQAEPSTDEMQALIVGDSHKAFRATTGLLDKLDKLNYEGSQHARAIAKDAYATARTTVIALLACAAGIATTFTVWIGRMISRPIIRAVRLTTQVASGDLTQRIEARGSDEPAQLLRALAHMQQQFVQTVSKVRDNAESVSIASAEIATGNSDLSKRTEQQATALQQSASAMQELSSTVRLNSDNARHADRLARSASEVATEGGRVVAGVVGTMKRIDESSRKISDIIAVIDGIAFQTNILALNAAVEAARAGEQGRGFAVVATEVRTLAQRSATAAKEIKQLIADSVERVGAGTRQVDRARQTMDQVVSSIDSVCQVVAQISTATDEQASGIAEIGKAVAQMDRVTQQNAALVEESANAAGSLERQASRLVEAVAAFSLAPTLLQEAGAGV